MSRVIDSRVVEMQFDNSKFNSNIASSQSALEKFDDFINKGLSSDGLTNMGSIVSGLAAPFTKLEAVAIGVLSNIATQAINTGAQMLKSLSVDQIAAGFEKYSDTTRNSATLLAQGFEQSQVDTILEKLLWYTDETSYNFTDMVSNISKFTASGQGLEDSYTAMVGIANWAALSGQNATTASRAMYQLSQAMSSGQLKKQDWMSIQNANMDTEKFRKTLIAAAEEMGTLKRTSEDTWTIVGQDTEVTAKNLVETLTEGGWATSDVMMATFSAFSSGVDSIYEYAEEKGITASEAIAELGNDLDEFGLTAFKAAQEARTFEDMIDSIKDAVSTGWMNLFSTIFGDTEESIELWTYWANELYDLFMMPTEGLQAILDIWDTLEGRTKLIEAVKNIWESFMGVVELVPEAFSNVFGTSTQIGVGLYKATNSLFAFSKRFKLFLEDEENLDKLRRGFEGLFNIFKAIGRVLEAFIVKPLRALFSNVFGEGPDGLVNGFANLGDSITNFVNSPGFQKFLDFFSEKLTVITSNVGEFISKLFNFQSWINDFESAGGGLPGVFNAISEKIREAILTIVDIVGELFGIDTTKAKETVNSVMDNLGSLLQKLGYKLQEFFDWVKTIDWKSVWEGIKSFFDTIVNFFKKGDEAEKESKGENKVGSFISKIIDTIVNVLTNIQNGSVNLDAKTLLKTAGFIAGAVGAIALIALAVKKVMGIIGTIKGLAGGGDDDKKGGPLSSIFNFITGYKDIAEGLTEDLKLAMIAGIIASIAATITAFAACVAIVASVPTAKAIIAIAGIVLVAGEMIAIFKILEKMDDSKIRNIALAMISYGAMIATIGGVFAALSAIGDITMLLASTLSIAAVVAVMVLATKNMENVSLTGVLALSVAMASLMALVPVFWALSKLSWEQLAISIVGIAAAVGILAIGAATIGNFIPQLLALAGALTLISVGASAVIASLGLAAAGFASIIAATTGLFALLMGNIPQVYALIDAIVYGIRNMANVLAEVIPIMATAIAQAIVNFCTVINEGGDQIIGAVNVILTAIFTAFYGVFPMILKMIGELITGILAIVLSNIPVLLQIVGELVEGVLQLVVDIIPRLLEIIGMLLDGVLMLLETYLPKIIQLVSDLTDWLLQFLYDTVPKLLDFLMFLTEELFAFLLDLNPKILNFVYDLIIQILDFLMEKVPDFTMRGVELVLALLQGIIDSSQRLIDGAIQLVLDVVFGIIEQIGKSAVDIADKAVETVVTVLNSISDSLDRNAPELAAAIDRVIRSLLDAGKKVLEGYINPFTDIGTNIIRGMINGISGGLESIKSAAKSVAESALKAAKNALGIKSPSREFAEVGMYSDEGLANGISKYGSLVNNASEGVAQDSLDVMADAMSHMSDTVPEDDMNPVITPVMDMSEIQRGMHDIDNLFSSRSYSIGATSSLSGRQDMTVPLLERIANGVNQQNSKPPVINISVNGAPGQNVDELADRVADRINHLFIRGKAVYGV